MPKSNNQKAKILYLQRMLQRTDENNSISMQQILEELMENGIRAERKSIYDDMEVLRSFGMNIRYKREKPNGYYLVENNLEPKSSKAEETPTTEKACESKLKIVDTKKPLRLICHTSKEQEAISFFGDKAEYKKKDDNYFQISVCCEENEYLYGWLVYMGKDIYIHKPKKSAQAYKAYLKMILREYKKS